MTILRNLRWLLIDETIGHERLLARRFRRLLPDLEDFFMLPRGGSYARLAVAVGTEEHSLDLLRSNGCQGIIAGPGMIAIYVIDGVPSPNLTARTHQDRALLGAFERGERRFVSVQESGV